MNYCGATEDETRAMDAAHRIHALGYLLQHIDTSQANSCDPLSMGNLLSTIADTGAMICKHADDISCYFCDLETAR